MDICTVSEWEGQPIGRACDNCGHTNVVHPGPHNPSIEECVLCVLVAQADEDDR